MKTILTFTVILVCSYIILPAQEPISFRSQALGGIISDDLDLIYQFKQFNFRPGTTDEQLFGQ
jgi:hypothetical protein